MPLFAMMAIAIQLRCADDYAAVISMLPLRFPYFHFLRHALILAILSAFYIAAISFIFAAFCLMPITIDAAPFRY